MELTGVRSQDEYLKNPEAQEKYQKHLGFQYKEAVNRYRSKYDLNVPDETLMMLTHFLGEGNTNLYLRTLDSTKKSTGTPDYNKAQEVVNDSIRKLTGRNIPKNIPIKDYIINFTNKLKEQE